MPKSIFDRVMDWPYHPRAIIALSFAGCFAATIQGGGPAWAALVASAIAAPFAALVLFMPYLAGVMLSAFALSLPSLIRAIQAALHKSVPATR
ncbi:MAG: hypothetical protein M0Q44_15905 [Methylobacter sp.]|jgi:hypothetical protein|nr:hypothetical protein [Methylobacter sp.]